MGYDIFLLSSSLQMRFQEVILTFSLPGFETLKHNSTWAMKIFKLFATDLMQRQSDHLPLFYQHMIQHEHENVVTLLVKKRDVIGTDFYRCCQALGKLSDQFHFEKYILEPLIGSILESDDPFDPLYDLKDFYEKKDQNRLVEVRVRNGAHKLIMRSIKMKSCTIQLNSNPG